MKSGARCELRPRAQDQSSSWECGLFLTSQTAVRQGLGGCDQGFKIFTQKPSGQGSWPFFQMTSHSL